MFRVCICLAVLVAVQASTTMMPTVYSTTHKPHHTGHHTGHHHHTQTTGEPTERDNLRFIYEAHTHQMLVINQKNCYIFTLSDAERTAVHTDVGIRTLELKLLNLISTATSTAVTLADQPKSIQHACGKHILHAYTVM